MTDQFLHPPHLSQLPDLTPHEISNLNQCFLKYFWFLPTHPALAKVRNIMWSVRYFILKEPIITWLVSKAIGEYRWHESSTFRFYQAEILFTAIMQTLYEILNQNERNVLRTRDDPILNDKIRRGLRFKYSILKDSNETDFPLLCQFLSIYPYQKAQDDALNGLRLYSQPVIENESDHIRAPASKDDVLEFLREIPYRIHQSPSYDDDASFFNSLQHL